MLFINRGIDLQGNCLRKDIVLNTETYKLNLLNCITILCWGNQFEINAINYSYGGNDILMYSIQYKDIIIIKFIKSYYNIIYKLLGCST